MSEPFNAAWYRRPGASWVIRLCGVALVLIAWRAGTMLVARSHASTQNGVDYALALIAFMGASTGLAATVLGAHLFDQVPVSSRWGRPAVLNLAASDPEPERALLSFSHPRSADSPPPDRSRSVSA